MPRLSISVTLALLVAYPSFAAPRRRAASHPAPFTRETITAAATRVADRVTLSYAPRLHWENAVYFDGLVLFGKALNQRSPGSGTRFIERAADVILNSDDAIESFTGAMVRRGRRPLSISTVCCRRPIRAA